MRTLRRQWPNSSLVSVLPLVIAFNIVIYLVYFCIYLPVLHDVVCISRETSVFWPSSYTLRLRLFAVVLMVFWRVRPVFVSCSCPSLSSIFGFFYVPNLLHKFQIRGRIVVGTERVLACVSITPPHSINRVDLATCT